MPNNTERDVEGNAKSSPITFPTPKYIFTIYVPNVVTISEDEQKEWDEEEQQEQAGGNSGKNNNKTRGGGRGGTKKSPSVKAMWRKTILAEHGSTTMTTGGGAASSTAAGGDPTTKKKYKKIRVKMHSLVVKMVNRLVRDNIIQRESVQYVPSTAYVTILILVSPSVLPVLMRKCEYVGIGCLTGQCFAVPLETSAVPDPKPTTATTGDCIVIDDSKTKKTKKKKETGATDTGASSGGFAGLITRTFSKEEDEPEDNIKGIGVGDDDDDADELSSIEYEEEDNSDDMNLKSSERGGDGKTTTTERTLDSATSIGVPSTIGVPLLGEKRIRELKNHIIKAREEWIATSSQVRVEQVIEEVTANAAFTVDYVAFVFCAATIGTYYI